MKVLHLIYDHIRNPWVGGGGAVRAHEIYRRLAGRHRITVVCGKYPGARDYEEGNLAFRFVGTERNNYVLSTFAYAVRAALFLRAQRDAADVVVEDFAPYNPVFSRFMTRRPAVLQVHHREAGNLLRRYFLLGVPFYLIERQYPRLFQRVICVSEASKEKFGLPRARVISNGIEEALLEAPSSGGDYIAYLGRLHIHNKGLDTLVKAMARVNGALSVAGAGRDEEKLRGLIHRSGISPRVQLRGFLPQAEKQRFLCGSQFLVLPSRYEGQGIVVLEAAACGKPVLVSDIPELRFAVEAGFGTSFRTGDAGDLADKMTELLGNEPLRRQMGETARRFARDYTWDRIALRFEEFLLKAAHTR